MGIYKVSKCPDKCYILIITAHWAFSHSTSLSLTSRHQIRHTLWDKVFNSLDVITAAWTERYVTKFQMKKKKCPSKPILPSSSFVSLISKWQSRRSPHIFSAKFGQVINIRESSSLPITLEYKNIILSTLRGKFNILTLVGYLGK